MKDKLIVFFGAVVLRLLLGSLRWKKFELDKIRENDPWEIIGNQPAGARILAVWHGQQILLPAVYLKAKKAGFTGKVYSLSSMHRDGRIAANIIGWLGIDSIAGSSTRGGAEALLQMIKRVSEGSISAFTPDGPKGPIHVIKSGVIRLSQVTGVKIYPVAFRCENFWQLRSWDKMIIPKPFSKCECLIGEPLLVDPQAKDEEFDRYKDILAERINVNL